MASDRRKQACPKIFFTMSNPSFRYFGPRLYSSEAKEARSRESPSDPGAPKTNEGLESMIVARGTINQTLAGALCAACVFAFAVAASSRFAAAGEAEPRASSAASARGCDAFAWPVSNEQAWFADKNLRHSASGVRLSRIDRAVELKLAPMKSIQFFLPPEHVPPPDSYGGEVTFFGVPHPGIYQVTVSRDVWIDVFENGTRLPAVGSSEARGCDGVRKSMRFALAPGDLVLVQISGASQPSIKVAFEEAPDLAGRTGAAAVP